MRIIFNMKDVQGLVDWNKAHTQAPAYEEMFDPQYYPNGVLPEVKGWPDHKQILTDRLPRCLHLVKDRGLYLMAGTAEALPSKDGKTDTHFVVYAEGCDPAKDNDYYDKCRAAFGGDDGVISIPLDWVDEALKANPATKRFMLDISSGVVALLAEKPVQHRSPPTNAAEFH